MINQILKFEVYCCPLLQLNSKPVCQVGKFLHFAQNLKYEFKVKNMKKVYWGFFGWEIWWFAPPPPPLYLKIFLILCKIKAKLAINSLEPPFFKNLWSTSVTKLHNVNGTYNISYFVLVMFLQDLFSDLASHTCSFNALLKCF